MLISLNPYIRPIGLNNVVKQTPRFDTNLCVNTDTLALSFKGKKNDFSRNKLIKDICKLGYKQSGVANVLSNQGLLNKINK